MFKSGYVAIVGSPNAGKSTFINQIIGRKISIVSDKVQTTRNLIKGIYNDEDSQIVFLDTPGFHKPKNKLQVYMNHQIDRSFQDVDLVVYMLDAKFGLGKKERENIEKIKKINVKKVIAVINKIDTVQQESVMRIIKELEETNLFDDILAMSAKEKFNDKVVLNVIKSYLSENVEFYDRDKISDYSDEFFVSEIIREKVLEETNQEVPHSIGVKVNRFENEEGLLVVEADIYVERDSQKGIIIGRAGTMLKKIGKKARLEIKDEFQQPVFLDIHVKVLSRWGQENDKLNEIGYEID